MEPYWMQQPNRSIMAVKWAPFLTGECTTCYPRLTLHAADDHLCGLAQAAFAINHQNMAPGRECLSG